MNTTTFKDHLLQSGLSVANQDSATARRFLTLALPLSPSKLVRGLVESALDNTNKGHLDMAEYHIAQALGEVAADNVTITAKAGEVKPVAGTMEEKTHDVSPEVYDIITNLLSDNAKLMQERDGLVETAQEITARYEKLEKLYFKATNMDECPATNGTIQRMKAAIAKAKGQS